MSYADTGVFAEVVKVHLVHLPLWGDAPEDVHIEHTRKYHEAGGVSYGAKLRITGPRGGIRFEQKLTLEDVKRWIGALGEVQAHLLAAEAGDDLFDGQRNYDRAADLLRSVANDLAPENGARRQA